MFNESWPWKRDLASAAERLDEARLGLTDTLDQEATSGDGLDLYNAETEALYRLERDVMSAAFAVRRLIGMTSKVTKATREAKATVIRYPLRPGAKAPDIWDALGDLEMYDMGAPADTVVTANEICNLFVHSLILRFAWALEGMPFSDWWAVDESDPRAELTPTELAGWLVASDTSSRQHLTLVPLSEFVRVTRVFASDEVTQLRSHRDRRGRMHFTAT